MKHSKPTPGPLEAQCFGNNGADNVYSHHGNKCLVATCHASAKAADAHLFAASHDLLAACEEVYDVLGSGSIDKQSQVPGLWITYRKMLKDAIAKAEASKP